MAALLTRRHTTRTNASSAPAFEYRLISTPVGAFVLVRRADGSLETGWVRSLGKRLQAGIESPRLESGLADRLRRYFQGEVVDFADVPTPAGAPFFRACRNVARGVPRGQTISYAELARRAGTPSAARAAGQAMRHNPLPIIVPCHRVIASSGSIGGFGGSRDPEGSELTLKRWLLDLERAAETFRR